MMKNRKKISNPLLYLCLAFVVAFGLFTIFASGGGGGDGGGGGTTDQGSAPTISNLAYSPTSAAVGSGTISVDVSVDFTDADGDISTLIIEIFDSSDKLVDTINETLEGVSGETSGTVEVSVSVDTSTAGEYTFELYIVDASNNESNVLTGDFSIYNTVSVSGMAVKGAIKSATVTFYVLNADGSQGTKLGETTTATDGTFSLSSIEVSPTGCYLLEITGGSYDDEITGEANIPMGSNILRAAVCDLSGSNMLAATPLTYMAANRAMVLALAGTPLKTAVASSNIDICQQYALASITDVFPVDPTTPSDALRTANRDQRNYGIVLAGISTLADTIDVTAIDLSSALAEDVSNGDFNGQSGSGPINIQRRSGGSGAMPATAGTTDLQNSINNFLGSVNNYSNINSLNIGGGTGLNTAGRVYTTTTVLPAWVSGKPGWVELTYSGGQTNATYKWTATGLPSWLSLTEAGVLSGTAPALAPGTTMSISAAFTVTVKNNNDQDDTDSVELSVTIIQSAPVLTIAEGCTFTKGKAGSCSVVANVTGGTAPYYYTLETMGGFPPMGMTLGTDGVLSGTPSAAGTYTFGVCVVDLVGSQDCDDATVTVEEPTAKVLFWMSVCDEGTVDIYVDGSYAGTLDQCYASNPGSLDAPGGLQLELTLGSHSFTAESDVSAWSGSFYLEENGWIQGLRSSSDGGGSGGSCPTYEDICFDTDDGWSSFGGAVPAECGCPEGTHYDSTVGDFYQCVCD